MDPPDTDACQQCGNCCRAPGYVRLRPGEPEALAVALAMTVPDFHARYTRLTSDRRGLSLTETPDGACVFLQDNHLCRVQAVKPGQCRDYPSQWHTPILDAHCPIFEPDLNAKRAIRACGSLTSHN
jgi:uncharacterized protein